MTTLLIAYIVGYLWFYRYTVGYVLVGGMGDMRPDAGDIGFGMFIGAFANIFWPVLVLGRVGYVLIKKHSPELDTLDFFPGPREIETKSQKIKRMEREAEAAEWERQKQEALYREKINRQERELDLPLTKW